jgi:hypothetical protein
MGTMSMDDDDGNDHDNLPNLQQQSSGGWNVKKTKHAGIIRCQVLPHFHELDSIREELPHFHTSIPNFHYQKGFVDGS